MIFSFKMLTSLYFSCKILTSLTALWAFLCRKSLKYENHLYLQYGDFILHVDYITRFLYYTDKIICSKNDYIYVVFGTYYFNPLKESLRGHIC